MPKTLSPLRYPGGKTKLFPYVKDIIHENNLIGCTYIEPFAGGAGLALKLLFNEIVNKIVINDVNPLIYKFWCAILNVPEQICELIESTEISLKERERCIEIVKNHSYYSITDVSFATLFLNRTSRSGIIAGGPIGGKKQDGRYKLDERFNRQALIMKIQNISSYANNIELYGEDIFDFLELGVCKDNRVLINFDPPYVKNGKQLYLNYFTDFEHIRLAEIITLLECDWIVTYDNAPLIQELYTDYKSTIISVRHTAGPAKKGEEILILSNNLVYKKVGSKGC